ncbi:MAG: hypothetical protein QOG04_2275 [Actinomycetota bacterium]|nr:hypothetical protein [Actinomycetota bacterium]
MADAKVLSLDHVTITTPEELEEEVIAWYTDVLGLTPVGTSGRSFEIGNQEVHLLIDPHNPPMAAHFCLRVSDLDSFVAMLRASKCHIEQASPVPGRKRCFTRDPAGNSIEITALEESSS